MFNINKTGFKISKEQKCDVQRKYKRQIRAKYDIPVNFTKAIISYSHH